MKINLSSNEIKILKRLLIASNGEALRTLEAEELYGWNSLYKKICSLKNYRKVTE